MIYQQTPPPPTSICIQHFVALHCNHESITHKCTPMTLQYNKHLWQTWFTVVCAQEENALFLWMFFGGGRWCAKFELTSSAHVNLPYVKTKKRGRLSPEWGLSSETCPKAWTHSFRRTARSERCISQPPLKQINPLKPWRAFSYILARGRWSD